VHGDSLELRVVGLNQKAGHDERVEITGDPEHDVAWRGRKV
jgi:hypothetical protein